MSSQKPPEDPKQPNDNNGTNNEDASTNSTNVGGGNNNEFDQSKSEDFQDLQRNATSITKQYFQLNSGVIVTGSGASFGDVLGDNRTSSRVSARLVRQAEMQKIEAVYTEPPVLAEAERALTKHRFVVLTGDAGSGKRSLALYLARNRWRWEHIYEMAPRQNLMELREFQPETNELCYIIDGVSDNFLDKASDYDLLDITSRLREKDCYLIITTQKLGTVGHVDNLSFIVHMTSVTRNSFQSAFDRHISYYSQIEVADTDAVHQLVVTHNLFEQVIVRESKFRRVDELALALVRVIVKQETIDEVIRRFASVDDETIKRMYVDACRTTSDRAFLIALAVFSGAPAQFIRQAANILESLLPDLGAKRNADESYDPLVEEQLLYKKCECRVNYMRVRTDIGIDERAVLEFKTVGMGAAVLRYVWNEYFWLHAPLVFWLREIGLSGDFGGQTVERILRAVGRGDTAAFHNEAQRMGQHNDLRVRAAVAIGELMRTGKDTQMLRLEAIHEWISQGKMEANLLVGVAVMVLMWDDVQRQTAMQLIYNWVHSDKTSRKPSNFFIAGVVAYGFVGLQYPNEALSNLSAAYQYHENALPVVLSAIRSIIDSAEQAQDAEVVRVVFQYLAMWIEAGDKRLHRLAIAVFLLIAKMVITKDTTRWPAPLLIAARSEADTQRVSQLFLEALRIDDIETRETAESVFENWGKRAEADWSKLAKTFDSLIRTMYASSTQAYQSRLRRLIQRLAEGGRGKSPNPFFKRFIN